METGIKMLMEAGSSAPSYLYYEPNLQLCASSQSYLGLFATFVLLVVIVLFAASFFVKDKNKRTLMRNWALAGLILAIIAIMGYLVLPYLLGAAPQTGCLS